MEEIRDCKKRLVCKGDAKTGLVDSLYKGCTTKTTLNIGGVFIVERDGIVTVVTRISTTAFEVESHTVAA